MCNASVTRLWYGQSVCGRWLANILPTNHLKPLVYVVDMSSPNIAKPFHVGHLRSTLVGQFTANLLEMAGNKVYRINYLGDWGSQFGLLACGFRDFGNWDVLNKQTESNESLMHLYEVYVKANQNKEDGFIKESRQLFADMEKGDETALKFWKTARQVSIKSFEQLYSLLNIKFDTWDGESMYSDSCLQLREGWEKEGLLEMRDGTRGVWGKEGHWRALFKSDGSSLYLTRDVAAALDRVHRFKPDKLTYVVEEGQKEHFAALRDALYQLRYENVAEMIEHVPFGRISGMKTRDGSAVFVSDLINEGRQLSNNILLHPTSRLKNAGDETKREAVLNFTISALIINFLAKRKVTNFKFDWNKALKLEGNEAAPYLQYQHARLCTLHSKFYPLFGDFSDSLDFCTLNSCEDASRTLESLRKLRAALDQSYNELDSKPFVTSLFEFAHTLGSVNRTMKVKNVDYDIAMPRFFLLGLCKNVLNESLRFLGVKPMNVM